MTYLLKDSDASLDYAVDWGADYLAGDVIEVSSWTVSPVEAGGAVIEDDEADLLVATVKVGGGIAGRLYRLTNEVTLASGRIDSRSIVLRVEQR